MVWRGFPVPALIVLTIAAAMLAPMALALLEADWRSARVFGQSAGLVAIGGVGLGLALWNRRSRVAARAEFLTVLFVFAGVPAIAAAPVLLLVPTLGFSGAYFEMVSTVTTTGATAMTDPAAAPRALHLWRAVTAWLGGFATLVAAAAVFAPRNLGGFEVQISDRTGPLGRLGGAPAWTGVAEKEEGGARLGRAVSTVGPVYAALTAALGIALVSAGQPSLAATVHAVGVVSTSGLTLGGPAMGSGWLVEAVALLFMAAAASRHIFEPGAPAARLRRFRDDPELELAGIAVGLAAAWLFLRHWSGALEIAADETLADALDAAWGALFTCVSFLTTTGYVSGAWESARSWSGLSSPGLLLLGLAAMGGGVASTAGGVKLLRSFALFQHGLREMDRLIHPSVAARHGAGARRVGFAGAVLAWVFVMLFILGLGVVALGLAAVGVPLERALAAAVATLANTGPAYAAAAPEASPGFNAMPPTARLILCAAMVLGRVEILAVVALANPGYWRR